MWLKEDVPDIARHSIQLLQHQLYTSLMPVDPSSKPSRLLKMLRDNTPQLTLWLSPTSFDLNLVQLAVAAGVDSFCLTTAGREVLINVLELTVLGEQILPRSAVDSLLNHASTVSGLGSDALCL